MDLETPITTQEQLDSVIQERVDKVVASKAARDAKKYEAYTSPDDLKALTEKYDKQIGDLNSALSAANEKAAKYDADIAERDAKIKGYETAAVRTKVGHEAGLPYELHSRLVGETEDEIRKDAESLAKIMKAQAAPPLAAPEKPVTKRDEQKAAYKSMLDEMKGEN